MSLRGHVLDLLDRCLPLYINDMPYVLRYLKTSMYADDTSLAYSAKSVSDISNVMNYELESLRKWLFSNKLSLNVAKATSMLLGTSSKKRAIPAHIHLTIMGLGSKFKS